MADRNIPQSDAAINGQSATTLQVAYDGEFSVLARARRGELP
jgi:hypothetical protein